MKTAFKFLLGMGMAALVMCIILLGAGAVLGTLLLFLHFFPTWGPALWALTVLLVLGGCMEAGWIE